MIKLQQYEERLTQTDDYILYKTISVMRMIVRIIHDGVVNKCYAITRRIILLYCHANHGCYYAVIVGVICLCAIVE